MMKKMGLMVLGTFLLSIALLAIGYIWYAMALMEGKIIEENILRIEGEFQIAQNNLMLEYGELRIGSHFLQPKIVLDSPRITVTTSQGVYNISVPAIEFRGSFWQYERFAIVPVGTIRIVHSSQPGIFYDLTLDDAPVLEVKGATTTSEETADVSMFFAEYRLDLPKKLGLSISKGKDATGKAVDITLAPDAALGRWQPVHYDVYPYLLRLIRSTESLANAGSRP